MYYSDVIMGAMASQITGLTIVYSTVYSGADQRKHQSSASMAFVRGIHRWPVYFPHKWPVTRKVFPHDDVIMCSANIVWPEYLQPSRWPIVLILAFYIWGSQVNYIHQCLPYPETGMLLRRWWLSVMYIFRNWKCGNTSVLYEDNVLWLYVCIYVVYSVR